MLCMRECECVCVSPKKKKKKKKKKKNTSSSSSSSSSSPRLQTRLVLLSLFPPFCNIETGLLPFSLLLSASLYHTPSLPSSLCSCSSSERLLSHPPTPSDDIPSGLPPSPPSNIAASCHGLCSGVHLYLTRNPRSLPVTSGPPVATSTPLTYSLPLSLPPPPLPSPPAVGKAAPNPIRSRRASRAQK
ncbi:hypothetical protein LY76DRAFT_26695 [Colletotrichum caudatum]|nr:hypothetical protein LY76DRAFT_26695 [Colletotrichum caudatum]